MVDVPHVLTSRCRSRCKTSRADERRYERRNERARSAAAVAVAGVAARHGTSLLRQPASRPKSASLHSSLPSSCLPTPRPVADCPRESVRVTVARACPDMRPSSARDLDTLGVICAVARRPVGGGCHPYAASLEQLSKRHLKIKVTGQKG